MTRGSKKKKGRRGSAIGNLTDDILADIISRVPYKSTCSCKRVCWRWCNLSPHLTPDHRKKMPQTLTGFFYVTTDISCFPQKVRYFINPPLPQRRPLVDPALSFLPNHEMLDILDCCNGLLLCCRWKATHPSEIIRYVVCNPAIEKWVVVPTTKWSSEAKVYLTFDPAVSSHFHVCEVIEQRDWDNSYGIDIGGVAIYSSKAGVWTSLDADARTRFRTRITLNKSVFLSGVLHWCASGYNHVALDVEEKNWKIAPLPRPESGGDEDASYDLFLSHGQLHFTHNGSDELSIWVLEDPNSEIWTKKYSISRLQLFGKQYSAAYVGDFSVISVHPQADNLIFIVAGKARTLMSYQGDSMKRRIIRQLGSDGQLRWVYRRHRARLIPYICSLLLRVICR
ncbi:unnamed protein product [Alopecurus aequalis]